MPAAEYSVYLVRCRDGSLYTGIAKDVARRIAAHEQGTTGAKYLRGKGRWSWSFNDQSVIVGLPNVSSIVSSVCPGEKKKTCSNCRIVSIH
jgi:hypothetical protein